MAEQTIEEALAAQRASRGTSPRLPTSQEITTGDGNLLSNLEAVRTSALGSEPSTQYSKNWGGGSGRPGSILRDLPAALGDTALTLGAGAINAIPAAMGGVHMLGQGVVNRLQGEENPFSRDAKEIQEQWSVDPLYTPQTRHGAEAIESIAGVFGLPKKAAEFTQDKMLEAGMEIGTSIVPTVIEAAPEFAASLLGARGVPRGIVANRSTKSMAKGLDLNPKNTYQQNIQGLRAAGDRMGGGSPAAAGMTDISTRIRDLDVEKRSAISDIFNEAKNVNTTISTDYLGDVARSMREVKRDFATANESLLNKTIAEFEAFNVPEWVYNKTPSSDKATPVDRTNVGTADLRDLMEFRERVVQRMPSDRQDPNYPAFTRIRKGLDDFLDGLPDEALQGTQALSLWKNAREQWKEHRALFDANEILTKVRKGLEDDVEVKGLLFGENAVTTTKNGASTVRALKEILGPESAEFIKIQESALADIMQPLMLRTANLPTFVTNLDKYLNKNPEMAKELFTSQTLSELAFLSDYAKGAFENITNKDLKNLDMARSGSVLAFGSGLSQKAAIVGYATRMLRQLGSTKPRRKAGLISEITSQDVPLQTEIASTPWRTGSNARRDIFPLTAITNPALLEGLQQNPEEIQSQNRMRTDALRGN